MNFLVNVNDWIDTVIGFLGVYGPILGCLFIIVESILPVLPLCVFITLNFLVFGNLVGFLVSWIFTVIGCLLSFFLFRSGFRKWFVKRIRKFDKADGFMKKVDKLKFNNLVVILAVPFTPAFLINIGAGLSKMDFRKYFGALVIGKIFMVYFWGFIGTSLIQSLTNPMVLIKVGIATIIAYVLSVIVNKTFNVDKE